MEGTQDKDRIQSFIDECAFAQVVETAKGDALLIGGRVIQFADGDSDAANLLSIALRRLSRGESEAMQGGGSSDHSGIVVRPRGFHGFSR